MWSGPLPWTCFSSRELQDSQASIQPSFQAEITEVCSLQRRGSFQPGHTMIREDSSSRSSPVAIRLSGYQPLHVFTCQCTTIALKVRKARTRVVFISLLLYSYSISYSILRRYSLIRITTTSSPRSQPRAFIHARVVNRLSSQQCRAILSLPKYRCWITPEVLAVAEAAIRKRVSGLSLPVFITSISFERLNKGVYTQNLFPLSKTSSFVVVMVARRMCRW
jgi:hypothetical protein